MEGMWWCIVQNRTEGVPSERIRTFKKGVWGGKHCESALTGWNTPTAGGAYVARQFGVWCAWISRGRVTWAMYTFPSWAAVWERLPELYEHTVRGAMGQILDPEVREEMDRTP